MLGNGLIRMSFGKLILNFISFYSKKLYKHLHFLMSECFDNRWYYIFTLYNRLSSGSRGSEQALKITSNPSTSTGKPPKVISVTTNKW